jgi:hypothetical protein
MPRVEQPFHRRPELISGISHSLSYNELFGLGIPRIQGLKSLQKLEEITV